MIEELARVALQRCTTARDAIQLMGKLVKGLDGRFFAHMEEIDLCWRLRSRGYQLVCIPSSLLAKVVSIQYGPATAQFASFHRGTNRSV